MAKTIFLSLEQVIAIHDDQIERYGGVHGIARLELLESAVLRPQTTFDGKELYPAIFEKAAAMLHSLVLNHAFVDGNKRTAIVSTLVFLELNGFQLDVKQEELVQAVLKIESKKLNLRKLSLWLKEQSKKI